jgi:hypothetical protein
MSHIIISVFFSFFEFDHHFSLDKVNLGYITSGLYSLGVTTKAADYHYLDGVTLIVETALWGLLVRG